MSTQGQTGRVGHPAGARQPRIAGRLLGSKWVLDADALVQ
jgi:hypothetical protein